MKLNACRSENIKHSSFQQNVSVRIQLQCWVLEEYATNEPMFLQPTPLLKIKQTNKQSTYSDGFDMLRFFATNATFPW